MSEWQKFKRALGRHPGVQVVLLFQGIGLLAGAQQSFERGLFTAAIMGVFWIPVFWSAWTGRK